MSSAVTARLLKLNDPSLSGWEISRMLGGHIYARGVDFYSFGEYWVGRRIDQETLALAVDQGDLHQAALSFSSDTIGEIEIFSPRIPLF